MDFSWSGFGNQIMAEADAWLTAAGIEDADGELFTLWCAVANFDAAVSA